MNEKHVLQNDKARINCEHKKWEQKQKSLVILCGHTNGKESTRAKEAW